MSRGRDAAALLHHLRRYGRRQRQTVALNPATSAATDACFLVEVMGNRYYKEELPYPMQLVTS